MAIGYSLAWNCQLAYNRFTGTTYNYCYWNGNIFGFYAGAIIAISGAVMLVGPDIAKMMRKLKGPGPDS